MNVNKVTGILKRVFLPGSTTLSQRATLGGLWVLALQIVQRVFGLVRTVILARLLAPSDFGLMGTALLMISVLETFSQTGFEAALIQKKDDIQKYLDVAWTFLVVRGIVLAGLAFLLAPLTALIFKVPEVTNVVRVIALTPLLSGLVNIGVVYWRRELDFGKRFLFESSKVLAEVLVSVVMAFTLRSVWALVVGLLAGNCVQLLMSYRIHSYRPKISLDRGKLADLLGFGRWVFGSSIGLFLLNQGDDVFVGSYLGATALGLYQMAYQVSNLPATQVTHIIGSVTFPAYARLQDDIPRLRTAFLKVLQLTAFVSIPLAIGLIILAPDLVFVVLGDEWMAMVPSMQVLAFWGLTRSLIVTAGPVYQAVGRPDIDAKVAAVKVFVQFILIYPLSVKWGILGTALAVAIPNVLLSPLAYWLVIRILDCQLVDLLKVIIVPFLGATVMIAVILGCRGLVGTERVIGLGITVLLGGVTYLSTMYFLDRPLHYGLYKNLGERLRVLKVLS